MLEDRKNSRPNFESLPENYWYSEAAKNIWQKSGEIPSALEIKAAAILKALNLPWGESSAIESSEAKKDRIIAQYLTNRGGVWIDKKRGVSSSDFRDLYPEGLPAEVKEVLDKRTLSIMEAEYAHTDYVRKRFGNTKEKIEADCPVYYFRLPGGVDVFLRGYIHDSRWQKNHGLFLAEANKNAEVICVESYADLAYGKSLEWRWWASDDHPYSALMHDAVGAGFRGVFAEVDSRDRSKVFVGKLLAEDIFPRKFYVEYLNFLKRECPALAQLISSPQNLEKMLKSQAYSLEGLLKKSKEVFYRGRRYSILDMRESEEEPISVVTFRELGERFFGDALVAIKLHLIANLMNAGYLQKGPIINYMGANHIPTIAFFLRYPQYAIEVILRAIPEVVAGDIEIPDELITDQLAANRFAADQIRSALQCPNWPQIIEKIGLLAFGEIQNNTKISKGTSGFSQIKVNFLNYLNVFGINPSAIIPSSSQIDRIIDELKTKIQLKKTKTKEQRNG